MTKQEVEMVYVVISLFTVIIPSQYMCVCVYMRTYVYTCAFIIMQRRKCGQTHTKLLTQLIADAGES